jgi:hypothetical protein
MKNLHLAILTLPLAAIAVGCDAVQEQTEGAAAVRVAADQVMWPRPPPAFRAGADATPQQTVELSGKAKHLVASDKQAAAWVQWVMPLPYSTGPITDPSGAACAAGQDGKYWFLAGTAGGTAERTCEVPADRHLVFPLLNWWFVFFPELYPDEEAVEQVMPELVAASATLPDGVCSLTLEIDGVDALASLDASTELFNVTDEAFAIEANDDNFASPQGFAGGSMAAMTAGYYVRLKPLPPGDHVLTFGGATCVDGEVDFATHTTFHLHVGP